MADIFISYARSTESDARRIAEALRALGHHVWRDDELPAHRAYSEVIEERLKGAKAVLVVWSAEAVKSHWVRAEADAGREAGSLVQLSIDGAVPPMPFNQIQCADMAGWSGEPDAPGWRKVLASIADLTGPAPAPREMKAPETKATARKLSICVLPFANMSEDPSQEYFSDGISEDIITDLSKVSALLVIARNTAFSFKGKSVDVGEVARRLGVSHILEGSVRKAGGRVRITAQLIEGASGGHAWAERWDRDLTDIFALQDEISQAIVAALRLKLLPTEKKAIEKRGTDSPEAYNLYLMARQAFVTGNTGDPRREETIIRLARRAVEIDPDYARAWAVLAEAQGSLRFRRGKAGEDGLAAAEKAIALDPDLAEAHAVLASIRCEEGDYGQALEHVDRALALDPDCRSAHSVAGRTHQNLGRFGDAERAFARAAALDETDFACAGMVASLCVARGDVAGAREAARMCLERVEAVVARDANNGHAMAYGVGALAWLGQAERAREWMDRALLIDPDNLLMRYNFACSLAADLGEPEAALAMLGPVLAECSRTLVAAARTDPDFAPVRADPRFAAMLAAAEARVATPPDA